MAGLESLPSVQQLHEATAFVHGIIGLAVGLKMNRRAPQTHFELSRKRANQSTSARFLSNNTAWSEVDISQHTVHYKAAAWAPHVEMSWLSVVARIAMEWDRV